MQYRVMQYRVMSFDGEVRDFDYTPEGEAQARAFYLAKKKVVEKAQVVLEAGMEIRPSCNIHRCYHSPDGNNQPCEIIEEYRK